MTTIKMTAQVGIAVALATGAVAEQVSLESFGVYVKTEQGYQPADVYSHYRMDFEYFAELPIIQASEPGLELLIYQPNLSPDYLEFETRPITTPGQSLKATPVISPLGETQYRVTFREEIPADRILLVGTGWGDNSLYAAALSNPLEGFLEGYKTDADVSPTTATWAIDKMLTAYPNNTELTELLAFWTAAEIQTKATEQYEFTQEAWSDYENSETAESKLKALENVKTRIEYYLEEYPKGSETAELNELLKTVTQKLAL